MRSLALPLLLVALGTEAAWSQDHSSGVLDDADVIELAKPANSGQVGATPGLEDSQARLEQETNPNEAQASQDPKGEAKEGTSSTGDERAEEGNGKQESGDGGKPGDASTNSANSTQDPVETPTPEQPIVDEPAIDPKATGEEREAPAITSLVEPQDLEPMTGFGHELWSGAETVVRVAGSGAPELFVQVDSDQTTMAQVGWLQELGDHLEKSMGSGRGTIHLLVSSGVSANESLTRPVFDTRSDDYAEGMADRIGPQRPHAAAADYLGTHPRAVHRVLLGFPEIAEKRIRSGGTSIGQPGTLPDWPQFDLDTWEDFVRIGLGVGASTRLQVEPDARSFYRLKGETEWLCESDGEGSRGREFRVANTGKILETCQGTRSPGQAAADLVSTLDKLARIHVLGDVEVTPMGGELWQVEFVLGAPTMQIEAVDPLRTYPRDSFAVQLDWGPTAATTEATEAPAMPSLAYLAWQPAGQKHFELLQTHNGSFRFPGKGIPEGARLRFGVQAPGGVGKLLGLGLHSRLHGEARVEFVAPSRKEAADAEEPVEETPAPEVTESGKDA